MKKLLRDRTIRILLIVLIAFLVGSIALLIVVKTTGFTLNPSNSDKEMVLDDGVTVTGEPLEGYDAGSIPKEGYYVLHKGLYYPIDANCSVNFDTSKECNGSSSDRVLMMTNDTFHTAIPTLYLGLDDRLCYYSKFYTMSYATLERYTDEGSSIGIYQLVADQYNGYYHFSVNEKDKVPAIYENSSAWALMNGVQQSDENSRSNIKNGDNDEELTYLTITDIGDVAIGKDNLSSTGIVKNLTEGEIYKTSIYNGTNHNDYDLTADTHFFTGMEAYAISNVPMTDGPCQEVVVNTLPDGYYLLNNSAFFRLVKGESRTINDPSYNERALKTFPVDNSMQSTVEQTVNAYFYNPIYANGIYSEDPRLNSYVESDDMYAEAVGSRSLEETLSGNDKDTSGTPQADTMSSIEMTDEAAEDAEEVTSDGAIETKETGGNTPVDEEEEKEKEEESSVRIRKRD